MTYLYQLRSYFTGQTLEIQQIGTNARESTYTVGEFDTDQNARISSEMYGREIKNARVSKSPSKENRALTSPVQTVKSPQIDLPRRPAPPSGLALSSSGVDGPDRQSPGRNLTDSARSSPARSDTPGQDSSDSGKALMTRKQLMNPFDSDDDEASSAVSPAEEVTSPSEKKSPRASHDLELRIREGTPESQEDRKQRCVKYYIFNTSGYSDVQSLSKVGLLLGLILGPQSIVEPRNRPRDR